MKLLQLILSFLPQSYVRRAYNILRDYIHPPITDVVLRGSSYTLSACHWMLSHAGVPVEYVNDDAGVATVEVQSDCVEDPLAMLILCAHAARCLPGDAVFQAQIVSTTAKILACPDELGDLITASLPENDDVWMLGADQPTLLDFTAYALLPAAAANAPCPDAEKLKQRMDAMVQPWMSSTPPTESESTGE